MGGQSCPFFCRCQAVGAKFLGAPGLVAPAGKPFAHKAERGLLLRKERYLGHDERIIDLWGRAQRPL